MADRYIDFSKSTGTLTGTWTFTNASASVTAAADGDAVNELANGDYIRQSDGTQWYKVTARPNADTITITPVFQQATHTDDAGASLYNSEDGSAVNSDFCHHNQAMTDEVRAAGDVIRVRGGLTYTYSGIDIVADEDGTANNYITLKGIYTAAGDDSWGDGNTTRAVIDFDDTAFQITLAGDNYWKVESHDIMQSADTLGALRGAVGLIVDDCIIHDNGAIGIRGGNFSLIKDSTLYSNTTSNLDLRGGVFHVEDCVLNGGGAATIYGIYLVTGLVYVKDTTFGVTTEHSGADIRLNASDVAYGRNVILDSTTPVFAVGIPGAMVAIEDYGQAHKAFYGWQFAGDVSIDTGGTPPSGIGYAILGEPGTNCGSEEALYIVGDYFWGFPIYLDGTQQVITVKIKAPDADWSLGGGAGGRPDNSELFIELDYHNGATTRTTAVSTEACADDTYTSYTVTITPDAAGPAYLKVKLLLYEAGGKIYIDPGALIDGNADVSQVIISAHGMDAAFEYVAGGGRRSRARRHGI